MIALRSVGRALICWGMIYLAATMAAGAAGTAATEAGPGASPKVIACMTTCEQTQMTCLQGALQTPVGQRTIKDINTARACNRAEETCDRRCRKAK